jgi:hypothetical protein
MDTSETAKSIPKMGLRVIDSSKYPKECAGQYVDYFYTSQEVQFDTRFEVDSHSIRLATSTCAGDVG